MVGIILSILSVLISVAAIVVALVSAHWTRLLEKMGSDHAEMSGELNQLTQGESESDDSSHRHASTKRGHYGKEMPW